MYQLPKLPYLFQDMEPYIDIHTMGLHYHKHEQNYLNQLNSLLKKNNYDYRYNIGQLIYHLNEFPINERDNILYNLGGVLNHNLYWKSMNPNSKQNPTGNLKKDLDLKYGSIDNFFITFKNMALKIRGSGYTFLVLKNNHELDIINLPNQETPLLYGHMPLFTVDMWEHAYYLNYKNEKAKYLDNFIEIADFKNASLIYNNIVK